MEPKKTAESFEQMIKVGQTLMQGFFEQMRALSDTAPNAASTGFKGANGAVNFPPPFTAPFSPLFTHALFGQNVQNHPNPLAELMPNLAASPVFNAVANLSIPPEKLSELQREHLAQHAKLCKEIMSRAPSESGEPSKDRRFKSPEWVQNPFYEYVHQAYLINAQFLHKLIEAAPVADKSTKNKLQFMANQYIDAVSPANFAVTNPDFLKKALDTQGQSITEGIRNLIADLEKGSISMTDDSAFEVGENLAITEGSVIYENELMQLIQYAPLTDKVSEVPLLIVPPCINKYYILDLQPENSYVRYAVEQGFTVFLISWRNPSAEQGKATWDDYCTDGVLNALEIVREVTKVAKPHALGFCIGGTLLSTALATQSAKGEDPVQSVTLLTTMLDFSDAGDLACFVDEPSVAAREASIGQGGLMLGREFSSVFSSLRPNDLVWNYVVDNYLLGNKPSAFDLLYWNADSTNLPGPFAAWYLRNTYLENNLRIAGKATVMGQKLDLSNINCPAFFVATREDHIVPWKTAYLGRNLLGGENTFVLGASGHIAGIINPPAKNKRSYWTSSKKSATAEGWLSGAQEHAGSWWPQWAKWLKDKSGKDIAARKVGNRQYKAIEAAPGRYVKEKA